MLDSYANPRRRLLPTPLVFILGYANTENVFYCFNIGGVAPPGGGGVLPHKRLMGTCRWMGSHFHNWIDYNGVAFSIEVLERGRTFSDFLW